MKSGYYANFKQQGLYPTFTPNSCHMATVVQKGLSAHIDNAMNEYRF